MQTWREAIPLRVRMFPAVAVLGGFCVLGSCTALQSLGVNPATITAIQQAAIQVCGFVPTVETILGIVTGGMSVIPATIANAICAAVTPTGVATGRVGASAPPSAKVGSTPVQGVFVR